MRLESLSGGSTTDFPKNGSAWEPLTAEKISLLRRPVVYATLENLSVDTEGQTTAGMHTMFVPLTV